MKVQFNDNLLLGVAASPSGNFDDWLDDFSMMKSIGAQCCRISLDWSRVEPRDGCFDESVIAGYRQILQSLRDNKIPVLLTLCHFKIPAWLEERGGFAVRDSVTCFLRYVRKIVVSLGDLASEYITFHEPNFYAYCGFLQGSWPPAQKSFLAMCRVMTHLAAAHIEAYGLIRKTRLLMGFRDSMVGVACHLRVFAPDDQENPLQRFWAGSLDEIFQSSLISAMCTGHASFPIANDPSIVPGVFCDFHGVCYYTRSTVSGPRGGVAHNCCVSDSGWEIYPEGIYSVCRNVYRVLKKPVFIIENTVCDENDKFRARFIAEHLAVISDCKLPIARYYCPLRDCLDPAGSPLPTGLVSVDFNTMKKSLKSSGSFYQKIIAEHAVSDALFRQFCDVSYPRNDMEAVREPV